MRVPSTSGNPSSGNDAYADGYYAGLKSTGFDDSHYTGAAVFDGGAWHSDSTMDGNAANTWRDEHASSYGHADAMHIWEFKDNAWTMY